MEALLVPTVKMLKESVAGSSLLALTLLMLLLIMMEVVRKLARLLQSALQSVMKIMVVVLMQDAAIMVVPVEGVPPLLHKNVWLLDTVKCVVWKSLLLQLSSPLEILLNLLMVNTYLNFATDVLIMLSVLLMELIAFGPILLVNVLKSALHHLRLLTHVMLILPVHVSVFLIVSVVGANMKRHTLIQPPRNLSLSPLVVACITTWPTNVLKISKLQDMRVH
jgi:hypothetical protein